LPESRKGRPSLTPMDLSEKLGFLYRWTRALRSSQHSSMDYCGSLIMSHRKRHGQLDGRRRAPETQHWARNARAHWKPVTLHVDGAGHGGNFGTFKDSPKRGNSLSYRFPISLYVLETGMSATEYWMSSSGLPFRQSLMKNLWEFCLSWHVRYRTLRNRFQYVYFCVNVFRFSITADFNPATMPSITFCIQMEWIDISRRYFYTGNLDISVGIGPRLQAGS
jgi:hypothetical protein